MSLRERPKATSARKTIGERRTLVDYHAGREELPAARGTVSDKQERDIGFQT
ncbi:hypothetical protein OM076_44155 [Solirubrobacter ginsenosidimutans]|uniref:Uncharacterized protein n=1 Tax=Solirubrobacter ginsenosidimutans TaxID=490573 RepID=A0A9X3N2U1_9ACTN|nr:hypothetical protein [Solirubrobacter ginsenosidimutans]MDA0167335.1 hypothetical protein [Solirubrobacter ginsenosidimutans]